MSNGMGREFTYLSSHATNHYFIPNWGNYSKKKGFIHNIDYLCCAIVYELYYKNRE